MACLFILFTVSLKDKKFFFFYFDKVQLIFFFLLVTYLKKKSLPTQDHKGFSIMFSFWSFIDLGFTFRSMICFELIFGYDAQCGQKFNFFFHVHIQLFQHHLLKRLYSVHQITFILFSKISCSCVWIYLWILYSVSLIFFFYIDANTVSHTPSYYSFMMSWNQMVLVL